MQKVVCIGQPKTGTTSINRLFRLLGLKTVTNPIMRGGHVLGLDNDIEFDFMDPLTDLHGLLESFEGFTDLPYSLMHLVFHEAFPLTKFILTLRDPHDWVRSFSSYIRIPEVTSRDILELLYGSPEIIGHEDEYIKAYTDRNNDIIRYFQNHKIMDRLLIVNVFEMSGDQVVSSILNFLDINPDEFPDLQLPHENKQNYQSTIA